MSAEESDEEEELTPPDPARVAARALVMSMVTCRAFIEKDAREAGQFWSGALQWFQQLGLEQELEPWEREAIETPLGRLEQQQMIDAQWSIEGLAVIAWALDRHPLPPYDEAVVASKVANSLGFLAPREETVLTAPRLRPDAEIDALCDSLFTLHWRLRDFRLNPHAMNLEEFTKTAWFGPLSLDGLRLAEGDLAVGDVPISKAPPEEARWLLSIAQERHRAVNWLIGESTIYSETATST
jgi:hypothetical protein